jgi:hypothetical protein
MEITFGITTDGNNATYLEALVNSIRIQKIPMYEIVIIGGQTPISLYKDKDVRWIPFDENQRPGHITRKKNIIVNTAYCPYICLMHDYLLLDDGWYEGLHKFNKGFGTTWNICQNKIVTLEGFRHSDWVVNPDYMERFLVKNPDALGALRALYPNDNVKYVVGLPYDVPNNFNKIQYISGAYIFAESFVLKDYPLNETLTWGMSEDLEWSEMVNNFFQIDFNPHSIVKLQRPNKWAVKEIPYGILPQLAKFYGLQYDTK